MPTAPRRSVMIVEDDHDIRVAVRGLLEGEGYTVLSATNGREALAVLRSLAERPGLVLVDLMMPVMDGWQFIDELHQSTVLAGIPFAVQSAHPNQRPPLGAVAV